MISKETFKLASDLKDKLEAYAKTTGRLGEDFYGAMNVMTDLMEKSHRSPKVQVMFNKWLKSKNTLDLKMLMPSSNLSDFNIMSYLDTVAIIK